MLGWVLVVVVWVFGVCFLLCLSWFGCLVGLVVGLVWLFDGWLFGLVGILIDWIILLYCWVCWLMFYLV